MNDTERGIEMSERRYTKEEIEKMKENAEIAITSMTTAGISMGFIPVFIDIAALMAAMGVGVIAIAKCYGYTLNKEDAGDLIKQFVQAAGFTSMGVVVGQKIFNSLLKSNPVSYIPVMISDAIICGATAYSVGSTADKYFRRRVEGKKVSKEEIRQWMKEGKEKGKEVSKKQAEEEAEKKKKEQDDKKN